MNEMNSIEMNSMKIGMTLVLIVTALFAWRVNLRHNENVRNIVKICDKVGLEYSVTMNHFGLRNCIIVK